MERDDTARLAALLQTTAMAHHEAFAATDGEDPEWPAWYAEYLTSRIELLGLSVGVADLADQLVRIDAAHREAGSPEPWQDYYARRLLDSFSA